MHATSSQWRALVYLLFFKFLPNHQIYIASALLLQYGNTQNKKLEEDAINLQIIMIFRRKVNKERFYRYEYFDVTNFLSWEPLLSDYNDIILNATNGDIFGL